MTRHQSLLRSIPVSTLLLLLATENTIGQDQIEASLTGYSILPIAHAPIIERGSEAHVIVRSFLAAQDALLEDGITEFTETTWDGDRITSDVALRGYQDDSLVGENFRIILERQGGEWRLTGAGRQSICARGVNPGKPITGRCP